MGNFLHNAERCGGFCDAFWDDVLSLHYCHDSTVSLLWIKHGLRQTEKPHSRHKLELMFEHGHRSEGCRPQSAVESFLSAAQASLFHTIISGHCRNALAIWIWAIGGDSICYLFPDVLLSFLGTASKYYQNRKKSFAYNLKRLGSLSVWQQQLRGWFRWRGFL